MSEYYYFVTSLPTVWMDREAPISYKEFLSKAKEQMNKSDYRDLLKATFNQDSSETGRNKIVKDWDDFIFKLNEMITEARAEKLGIKDEKYISRASGDSELKEKVKRIVDEQNALKAEKMILSLYFDFLSNHPLSSIFSSDALMIYSLKLQIKEKEKSYDRDTGRAEFDRLFSDIQKDIFHKE